MLHHLLSDASIRDSNIEFFIFTYSASKGRSYEILQAAATTFNINLTSNTALSRIHCIFLRRCDLLDPARYPRFTMVLQSVAALVPAFEALCHLTPDIMIDTAGE